MVYEQKEGQDVTNTRKSENKCDKNAKNKCTETEKQVVAVEISKNKHKLDSPVSLSFILLSGNISWYGDSSWIDTQTGFSYWRKG